MKNITKTTLLLMSIAGLVSCEINDPVDDWARIGQEVPHTVWELSSTKVKAGENLAFKAQYYTKGEKIDRLEVWYDLTENKAMEAKCPFVSFNYSLSVNVSSSAREEQSISQYVHSEENWDVDKRAYIINETFPVSNTLRPVEWKDVVDFDSEKFSTLFPDTFATAFKNGLYEKLEQSTYLTDYRAVLVTTGEITVEDFNACLDSTFNENRQDYDKFVKEERKAELKSKYNNIPFEELIYKSSESKFQISYLKSYSIGATFRVYDEKNNQGVSEKFTIEII